MYTHKLRKGASGQLSLQVRRLSADGVGYEDAEGVYTGSEPLSCSLWPGDDRAQAASLAATWEDAPAGKVRVEIPSATTIGLAVGAYKGAVTLTATARDVAYFRLEVESSPGSAAEPKAYHTYADLTAELPWVGKLANPNQDQSGFAELAGEARRWIDAAILRSVPSRNWPQLGFGYGGGLRGGSSGGCRSWGPGGVYGSLGNAEDPTIAAALDANQLIITTATGRRFVQASVYYTLYKILRRAAGMQQSDELIAMAAEYKRDAEAMLNSCTAEIDTNGDGVPEYVFPLGRVQVRRA
jgi:hypothetical protein